MRDDNPWKLSEEFLIDSAERRADSGDLFGALSILNKREDLYASNADAWALYADIYESLELWPLAADAWFRFLDVCNEADFPEGYEGLAVVFFNMGNELQSAFYYSRAYPDGDDEDEEKEETDELAEFLENFEPSEEKPRLHIVGSENPEALKEGLELMREGELKEARDRLLCVEEESPDYPSAAGLAAMCLLMLGEEEEAQKECEDLLAIHPENVQALTTYIAVLGARGEKKRAKEAAARLASFDARGTDDLYRIATALCETGLDEEAFKFLTELKRRLPYDDNVLYFYAVAAYHLGRTEDAILSLETLTTIAHRKKVAEYYLERLRRVRDGEEKAFEMSYFYRLPQVEYRRVANFLLAVCRADEEDLPLIAETPDLSYYLHVAFDELEGRDEKLQLLAVKAASRIREDEFLRAQLVDYMGSDLVKFAILHEFTARNVADSFGTVFINLYREFFTHTINIGQKKAAEFLDAFADVYSKYAILGEENEGKICGAAEDIYAALEDAEAWRYMNERAALASAIFREARIRGTDQSLKEICDMFDANRYVTQEILDFLM